MLYKLILSLSYYFKATEKLINAIGKNSILKRTKDAKFDPTLIERKISFLLIELTKPVKLFWRLVSYLDVNNENNCNKMVSTTTHIWNRFRKHLSIYTKTIIRLRLLECIWTRDYNLLYNSWLCLRDFSIMLTSPSANNC